MKFTWLLFVLSAFVHPSSGLRLNNNGYEDLYIVIQDSIKENDQLMERIKVIFQEASTLLYKATQQRAYFKSILITVPRTWTKKESYRTVSALSSSTSHIRIGKGNMKTPVTVGSNKCGQKGLYTFLHHKYFVLKTGATKWGKHDSVIVHEWGHLRWGLKDEYPTIRRGSRKTWNFYQAHGKWNPVGCSRNMQGYASKSCKNGKPDPKCDVNNVYNIIGKKCKFCPDLKQALNASIMSFQYIPSVIKFCDKDDPSTPGYLRHDSEALNEQNMYCNGKSAWEIMREHDDFKDDNNPPLTDDIPPVPEFIIAQETDTVRVLVLDTSGSMSGDKIKALYQASKLMIESYLPDGSWLSMVDFDSNAVLLSQFVQIDSNSTRHDLVSKLPQIGSGGTCIPCGLNLASSTLKSFEIIDSTEESEVILISDGENNDGDLEQATQTLVNAGIVVHCIAVTQAADQRLQDISRRTGGRCYAYTEGGSVSLAILLSEIISGGSISGSSAAATMMNEQLTISQNVTVSIIYNIDEGIGKDTTVSVISKDISNIKISVSGPYNFTQIESADQVESLSLLVPDISEPGQYTAEITSSRSTDIEVIVTSKPISADAEVIRPWIKLSTDELDFTSNDSLPSMYGYLRKGESPIKNANVTATFYGPQGQRTCELSLLDNGVDPDIKLNDGIYTAYVHRGCQGGNGRHNSKVSITGNQETVVTVYTSSKSAVLDDETDTGEDTATGNFERVAVPDAYTVINYIVAADDITPPGRITDLEVIDIHSGIPSTELTRNYTITWTATGDDLNIGQASLYEMRVSNNLSLLRHDFKNGDLLNVSGVNTAPNSSGSVERLQMVVSSRDDYTSTTFFAIVVIDEVGNRGLGSNIIPITVGQTSELKVVKEECTDDCYAIKIDCGGSVTIANGLVDLSNIASTPGNVATVICDDGYKLIGGTGIECQENGTWSESITCEERALGDNCAANDDCSQITNGECAEGEGGEFICVCKSGYSGDTGNNTCSITSDVDQQKLNSTSISVPAIIGICFGGFFLIILGLLILFVLKRRNQHQSVQRGSMIENGCDSKSSPDVQDNFKLDSKDLGLSKPKEELQGQDSL